MPNGIVTFLFTDIEGSTRLWKELPEKMRQMQARHDELIRLAVSEYGGVVFKTVGDQVCAAFSDPADGVGAAVAAQEALRREPWEAGIGAIRVRMGLHSGSVELRDDDYFGLPLSHVARLHAAAHGGQILVSRATAALLERRLPAGATLLDLGSQRLKDLDGTENVYQLNAPGLETSFPPLRTAASVPNTLPQQTTPLIGRANELTEIGKLLESTRLVTLVGPGGTGKTRLSIEAASTTIERFPDGVYFVPLDTVTDPEQVPSAIAEALSIVPRSSESVLSSLARSLRDKAVLLLLDNFEQVSTAARVVATLLSSIRGPSILVTSREPLRIAGEREYQVPPLMLPDARPEISQEEIESSEAVMLFCDRARAVNPSFELTADNARAIFKICSRLDGLPLAIELAAARLRLFSPAQLEGRLADSLQVLAGNRRDLPERQKTLRGAIEWSYNILSEEDRLLFQRLAAFVGSFTLDAAEQVCVFQERGASPEVLDGIESLLNKSLLRRESSDTDPPRFRMMETIRAFANEQLAASGEEQVVRARHARFFSKLVEGFNSRMSNPSYRAAHGEQQLRSFFPEMENVRAALAWSIGEGDPEVGISIVHSLRTYLHLHGLNREMRSWCDRLLSRENEMGVKQRGRLHLNTGWVALILGDEQSARNHLDLAIEYSTSSGDRESEAYSRVYAGMALTTDPRHLEDAEGLIRSAQEMFRTLGHEEGALFANSMLGDLFRTQGRYREALECFQSLEHVVTSGFGLGNITNIGFVLWRLGDSEGAESSFRRALEESRADSYSRSSVHYALLGMAAVTADERKAAHLVGAGDRLVEQIGVSWSYSDYIDYRAVTARLEEHLGSERYESLHAEGAAMSMREAIEYALS